MFSDGKKPIEVAIKLDLGADEVDRLYQQFWRLQGLDQLNQVYKEIGRYIPSFLKLFKIMKQQKMMSEHDVVDALKFGKELVITASQKAISGLCKSTTVKEQRNDVQ